MSRARIPESLLAGLATVVVGWPLTTLFSPATWVRPMLAVVAVVVLCGILARLVTGSATLVALAQTVGLVLVSSWLFGQGHLWRGLPTPDMVLAFNNLLVEARLTIQNYAAPAPTNRGVILAIALAIGLTGIIVDHLAVMRRSPALAGLPLLTAFLASASNSGESLPPVYFVVAGGVWLMMLGRQGVASLRRWSTTVPMSTAGRRHTDDRDGTFGYAAVGRTLAVAGLVSAIVLPVAIPHFPTRYLIDGLGRSVNATGFSDGQIGLRTTLDLAKSLANPSTAAVLTYTSNAPTTTPLRVGVLETYGDDKWVPEGSDVRYAARPTISLPRELDDNVPRQTYRIAVDQSRIEAPQIAAPTPLVSGDLNGVAWGLDSNTSVASVASSAHTYSFSYAGIEPTETVLGQPTISNRPGYYSDKDLAVDPASEPIIGSLLSRIVPADSNRIQTARAIQRYLRSDGGFTYSLKLADSVTNAAGQVTRPDAITLFLESKKGYCVQFATAMVMMARASGIPARMAIGFLPGTVSRGTYTVRAADAHAWPELYFDAVGWLRFEPTPSGTQNTVAPAYTFPPTTAGGSDLPTSTATGVPTTSNPRQNGRNDPGKADPSQSTGNGSALDSWLGPQGRVVAVWLLIGLVIGLLGSLAVPLAARSRVRRRLRQAPDEAGRVEVEWESMVERIADLGVIPPRGSTPRQAGHFFRREAYLEGDESQAMSRIVDGVERSRYARPGTTVTDIRQDTQAVLRAVTGVRRRKDRLRAVWWPQEGVTEWRERRESVARAVRRPWERLLEWRRGDD